MAPKSAMIAEEVADSSYHPKAVWHLIPVVPSEDQYHLQKYQS